MALYVHANVDGNKITTEYCVPIPMNCPNAEHLKKKLCSQQTVFNEQIRSFLQLQIDTVEKYITKPK